MNKSEYMKKWRKNNPDKCKAYSEKWNPILNKRWNSITHAIHSPKRLTFKNRRIELKENPRKGICQRCGKSIGDEYINKHGKIARIKRTSIHHIKYHDDDPLKDTIELCNHCHKKEHINDKE